MGNVEQSARVETSRRSFCNKPVLHFCLHFGRSGLSFYCANRGWRPTVPDGRHPL